MRLSFPSVQPTFKHVPRFYVDRVLDSPMRHKRRVVAFKVSSSRIVQTFVSYAAFANRVETPQVPAIERKESSRIFISISFEGCSWLMILINSSDLYYKGLAINTVRYKPYSTVRRFLLSNLSYLPRLSVLCRVVELIESSFQRS